MEIHSTINPNNFIGFIEWLLGIDQSS